MKTVLGLLSTAFLLTSLSAFSHDGHDHGAGQIQPTKGGIIMKSKDFYLEAVGSDKDIRFYPLKKENEKSNNLKAVPLKDVKLSATYTLPRGKTSSTITLVPKGEYFEGAVSAKGTHRYQVDVSFEIGKDKEKFIYQIEPQE